MSAWWMTFISVVFGWIFRGAYESYWRRKAGLKCLQLAETFGAAGDQIRAARMLGMADVLLEGVKR